MLHHEWKRPGLPMLAGEEPATEDSRSVLASSLAALWSAEFADRDRFAPASQLQPFVQALGRAARATGMPPEQFLTVVKESWSAQPAVRRAADLEAARDRLSAIITACIHEFFLSEEPASPPMDGSPPAAPA